LWRRIHAEEAMLLALPGYAEAMSSRGRLLPRIAAFRPQQREEAR
jgi:hypothetical protein